MKFFSKEVKIAITAILAIVIIYLGIIFLKGLKLFSTDNIYYVEMKDVGGLANSSEVQANGLTVGLIKSITYNQERQSLTVAIELDEGFQLTKGTTASVMKEMLGGAKLSLNLGPDPKAVLAPGETIYGVPSVDLMTAAGEMVPQVQALMPKLDSILTALNTLANDPVLQGTMYNVNYLTADLRTTTNQVNSLLGKDMPQLIGKANVICDNLETTTANLNKVDMAGLANNANQTMLELQSMTSNVNTQITTLADNFNNSDGTVNRMLKDPSMYVHMDSTMQNASRLLEDFRLHPKRYVHFSLFGKKDKE